jgi:hypothetical protein
MNAQDDTLQNVTGLRFRVGRTFCGAQVQMIRKGQVLGITKKNLHGQAWVFGSLLGLN